MGSKLNLKSVNNLASTEMEAALTSNFNDIEDAIDDCLSRTGKTPNQLEADLDMNNNTITNVKEPVGDTDVATKGYVDNNTTDVEWKGDWSVGTDYARNNVVIYLGSAYICTADHTSSISDTPDTFSNWDLIVSKGDKGDPGELTLSGVTLVSANYTVTKSANASGLVEVNTASGPVVLTVDDSSSSAWFFYFREIAGSNGVTIKKASDGSTVTTYSEGTIVCYGTTVTCITDELPDGIVTEAKIAAGAVTPPKIDSTGAYTVDSLTATTTLKRGTSDIWGDDNFAARIAALTANTSPAGTESVACDDGQKVTLQAIADLAGSGPDFISGAMTFPALNSYVSVAHGLPSFSRCDAYVKCIVAEGGYSVGDIVKINSFNAYNFSSCSISIDSNNVTLSVYNYSASYPITIAAKTGSSIINLHGNANWELYLEAYK